jgi:hypothetical protein
MDMIVELHEEFTPGIIETMHTRFEISHDITFVPHTDRSVALPDFFQKYGHLDHLLAIWEWRNGPTPWVVMLKKSRKNSGARDDRT